MKKLLYFTATALGLCIIFGSGWAAGTGRINSYAPADKISPAQVVEESEPSDDKLPEEPREHSRPRKDEDCEDDGDDCKFRFKMPYPADFRDRFGKLPYFN